MFEALTAVFEPFRANLIALQQVAPRIAAALLLLLITWGLAAIVRRVSRRSAQPRWLEWLLQRSGLLSSLTDPSAFEPRRLLSNALFWIILLAGATWALHIVNGELAAALVAFTAALMPKTAIGLLTVAGANWLGRHWARSTLIWMTNEGVAFPWRWAFAVRVAVLAFGVALASEFTGVAQNLIRPSFLVLLSGTVFAICYGAMPSLRLQMLDFFGEKRTSRSAQKTDDPLLR